MFVLLHSLFRNTIPQALKKEFFERFYMNRQVVQEAVSDYDLIIIGSMKRLGKKKLTVNQLTSHVYEASINEKDIRPKCRQQTPIASAMRRYVKRIFYNGEFDPGSG